MMANVEAGKMELIRVSDAARLLGTHTMAIYRMIRDGRLRGYKIAGCVTKIDRNELLDLINASHTQA